MPSHQRSALRRAWVAAGLVLLWLLSVDLPAAQAQATTGSWQLGPDLPFFPVHDHVLPDGKVMLWPGDQGINGDDARSWDPATGTVTPLAKAGFDIFCSGHSFLPESLSRFPCKPRVTNTVNVSQGEPSWEEDDQRVQRCLPAVGSSSRFPSSLAGDVAQPEVE